MFAHPFSPTHSRPVTVQAGGGVDRLAYRRQLAVLSLSSSPKNSRLQRSCGIPQCLKHFFHSWLAGRTAAGLKAGQSRSLQDVSHGRQRCCRKRERICIIIGSRFHRPGRAAGTAPQRGASCVVFGDVLLPRFRNLSQVDVTFGRRSYRPVFNIHFWLITGWGWSG